MQEHVAHIRRELHAFPETRFQEAETLKIIMRELAAMGYSGKTLDMTGGISLDLDFPAVTGPRVLFRADIDGLPIHEQTGLEYAATNGNMHACGHDTHAAMLLGFLWSLRNFDIVPCRPLRIVFQRAEENPGTDDFPKSGGYSLVQDGILTGVSRVYGLHIWATGENGTFYSRPGALLGNSDRLFMTIRTSGGHVAQPHNGVNALRVARDIMVALEGLPNRLLGPIEPWTLEPAILNAGTGSNIMPSQAELAYGVRTMLAETDRDRYVGQVQAEVAKVVSRFQGATVEFRMVFGHPSLINTPESFFGVRQVLEAADQHVRIHAPVLGGEDFAHYLKGVPGSFWMLGAGGPGSSDHHMPTFNPSEDVLWQGVLFWLALATAPELDTLSTK